MAECLHLVAAFNQTSLDGSPSCLHSTHPATGGIGPLRGSSHYHNKGIRLLEQLELHLGNFCLYFISRVCCLIFERARVSLRMKWTVFVVFDEVPPLALSSPHHAHLSFINKANGFVVIMRREEGRWTAVMSKYLHSTQFIPLPSVIFQNPIWY